MHLFVEAEFLLDFEKSDDPNKRSIGQERLFRIFTEYTNLIIYIDCPDKLIDHSRLFRLVTDNNPSYIIIGSFKDYFQQVIDFPDQSLVFTKHVLPNNIQFKKFGLLCFTWDSYEGGIKKIMDQIHVEYLLAEREFTNWGLLGKFSVVPIRKLIIEDPYVLCDKKNQKIDQNLLPLLKSLLNNRLEKSSVYIYTNVLKSDHEINTPELKCAQNRHDSLKSKLSTHVNEIYILESNLSKKEYNQHDRYLYSPYTIISVGKGFNLFPLSKSNSTVRCLSIFDKVAYRKLTSHIDNLSKVTYKILRKENRNAKFNMFPETETLDLF